ncbi:hypothetical protein AAFF_G00338690 [Aldrovandia affinis]|uniref:Uncharacterized protein n=1 Tax=Aldrovandia affinis TaxID=143900 RepID=A0AAD7R8E3_9TELE|nr:hypothetical protein AAFF_G00338690 [Aldrovandia affinis]
MGGVMRPGRTVSSPEGEEQKTVQRCDGPPEGDLTGEANKDGLDVLWKHPHAGHRLTPDLFTLALKEPQGRLAFIVNSSRPIQTQETSHGERTDEERVRSDTCAGSRS